jgi:putative peptidoglycan lipid II flippase
LPKSNFFNATKLTLFAGLGLCLQFANQLQIAFCFGASAEIDALYIALTIPNYIVTVFAFCISNTFLPQYLHIRAQKQEMATDFTKIIFFTSFTITLLLAIFGYLFQSSLLAVFFHALPKSTLTLAISLSSFFWVTIVFNLLFVVSSSRLQAEGHYTLPSIAPLLGSLITIAFISLFSRLCGTKAIAYGVLAASICQFAVVHIADLRWMYSRIGSFPIGEIKKMQKNFVVLLSGNIITRFAPVMERMAISALPPGKITELNYANRLSVAISTVITSGIGVIGFTRMSKLQAKGSSEEFHNLIRKLIRSTLLIIIPIAMFLCFSVEGLIRMLFSHGKFNATNVLNVSNCVKAYIFFIVFSILGGIIGRGLYALQMTKIASILDVVGVGYYGVILFAVKGRFGAVGIAWAYSLYFLISVTIAGVVLFKKTKIKLTKADVVFLLQCIASIVVIVMVELLILKIVQPRYAFFMSPIPFAIFFAVLYVLKNEEMAFFIGRSLPRIKAYLRFWTVKKAANEYSKTH